jgi:uncharacterized protein
MTATLLDINILIALLDPVHIRHNLVHDWFARQVGKLWASCPITQNGYIRIVSQQRYPNPLPIGAAVSLLREFTARPDHIFWPDSISLLTVSGFSHGHFVSHRQVTDSYLLALARAHGGILATLDSKLNPAAIESGADHLHILL